jgi:hypothetical protein
VTRIISGRWALRAAILSACAGTASAEDAGQDLRNALAHCTAIAKSSDRLACYDNLAGRSSARAAAPSEATGTAPVTAPVTTLAPVRTAAPVAEFGLSEAQKKPAPNEVMAIAAKISGFGQSANGRARMVLDNGEVWEIEDGSSSFLAIGDSVSIKRASLGSFLMSTPLKVSMRVRRIK